MPPSVGIAALLATAFLLAHEFVPRLDSCAWGLDALAGLPDAARAVALAAGVAIVGLAVWLSARIDRLRPRGSGAGDRSAVLVAFVLCVLGLIAFTTWPSATGLLGDGQLRMRDLDATRVNSFDFHDWQLADFTAPLGIWLYAKLHELGGDRSALATTQSIAYGCGVAYVWLAILFARRAGRTLAERIVLAAFLLGSGSMQIFFGYPENYAFLFPMLLVYGIALVRDARTGGVPWRSALALSVLLALHFFSVTLLPALLVVAWRSSRRALAAPVSLVLPFAFGALWLALIRFPFLAYGRGSDIAKSLPWFGEPDGSQAYRMLDLAHGRDLVHLLLLVAPAPALALVFSRRGERTTLDLAFAAAAFVPLAAVAVANPTIGAFRDWDILSYALLPLAWLAARVSAPPAALVLAAAGLWHTAGWVHLNADADRTLARFERLVDHCPLSKRGAAYAYEDIARRYVDSGDFAKAAHATLRGTDAAPDNPRLWLNAGELLRVSGDLPQARRCFERSRSLKPDWVEPTHLLALLLADMGSWEEAIREFRRTLEIDPSAVHAWYELGVAYLRNGQLDAARESLLRFREIQPQAAAVHFQLGEVEHAAGDAAAREHYERAIALDPEGTVGKRSRERLAGP